MNPQVVSRQQWLGARRALLAREKELTRERDALSAQRRELPRVALDKDYVFTGPGGAPTSLLELFDQQPQLIVYHFMFDPSWEEGCPSCSYLADHIDGMLAHLSARRTALAVVSRAPVAKIEPFRRRMGWTFPWLSSQHSQFNDDFHVTLDETVGSDEYNYADAADLRTAGKVWIERGELPGLSVFLRDGQTVFHTYSTYQRGLDLLIGTYNYLDLTPLGRGHDDQDPYPMAWLRHHDRYPDPAHS